MLPELTSQLPLIALIVAVVGGGILVYKHFFQKSTTTATASSTPAPGLLSQIDTKITSAVSATEASLKAHITSTVAAITPKAATSGTSPSPAATGTPPAGASATAGSVGNAATPAFAATAPAASTVTNQYGTSNTPNPALWPAFSPGGYPYFYALEPDGKGGSMPTTDSAGQPVRTVIYNGRTFPTDAAVATYIGASAAAASQPRTDSYGSCNFSEKVPAANVTLNDAMYLVHMDLPFRLGESSKLKNAGLYFCILSGSQVAISDAVNVAQNAAAATIKFNPATYIGQFVKVYNDLVAGINAGTVTATVCDSATGNTVG